MSEYNEEIKQRCYRVSKVSGSMVIRPTKLLKQMNIEVGDIVKCTMQGKKMIVEKVE